MNRIPKWASKTSYNSPAPQSYQDTHISSPRHKSPQNNDLWSSCLSLSLECDTCNYRTSSTPIWVCVSFSPCLPCYANLPCRAICLPGRDGASTTSPLRGLVGGGLRDGADGGRSSRPIQGIVSRGSVDFAEVGGLFAFVGDGEVGVVEFAERGSLYTAIKQQF